MYADAVESANIVGYTTVTVERGKYHALGVQFMEVASDTATMPIKSILTCNNPKGWSTLNPRADQIHVWTGMEWVKYFYSNTLSAWVKQNESVATEDSVANGATVFFLRSSMGTTGDTITLPGTVNTLSPSVVNPLSRGAYHFITYPWPVEFAINDFVSSSSNPKGWSTLNPRADQVHRWTGMEWKKYYYSSTLGGYVASGESVITTDKLNVGEGIFFLRSSMGASGDTITFAKPTGL